jgi:RNA 3'-terminal phosphate cyclase (ATP)
LTSIRAKDRRSWYGRCVMIEIDGSEKSGSGTIVRDAVPFSILMGEEIRLYNIRAKRDRPGLRPQHLKAMEAAARICEGRLDGGAVASREIRFKPGAILTGGKFTWDIGTAGSTAMLVLCLTPLALFADKPSSYRVSGGLFQDFAPSLFHLKHVLLPALGRMGVEAALRIIQPGYVPRGGGQIEVEISPLRKSLKPLKLTTPGRLSELRGIALSSMLKERRVSERMAKACEKVLRDEGHQPRIEVVEDSPEKPAFDRPSLQAGAALAIWAETDAGCLLGADMAGARGRTAEFIGEQTALMLLEDLDSGATVDRHLGDQLIPFAALAEGRSIFIVPRMTDHVEARLWLVERILKGGTAVRGKVVTIDGIGYRR